MLFKSSPMIAGYQFDAVLEDSIEASIELTRYPVESGARVNDHRIINPVTYYIVGAVSNNPLKPIITDIAGGGISNITSNPIVSTIIGMSAGFLAGSNRTRSSATLEFLFELLTSGQPFDIDTVDMQLKDMVLTKVSRSRDPENENGLIFIAEAQELISLSRLPEMLNPSQDQLNDGDPSKTSAAAAVNRGQQIGSPPDSAIAFAVRDVASIDESPL